MHVIVIGAGVIGTTTAWYLNRLGHDVTLLDRAGRPGEETSFANGGLLHASHAEPWNAPGVLWQLLRWLGREDSPLLLRPAQIPRLTRWGLGFLRYSRRRHFDRNIRLNAALAVYSLRMLRELRRDTGLRYDDRQSGILKIFRDQAAMDKARHASTVMDEAGVRYSVIDGRHTVALEPALADVAHELVGAIYYPDDESGDACLFTQRLAELACGSGVRFLPETGVRRLKINDDRILGLETDRGHMSADAYVLAAGSYSPRLARQVGLRLPIYPVKGYSATLPADGWNNQPAIPVIDDANKVVMAILGNRVRMAGTAEFAGYDLSLSEKRAHGVVRQVIKTFPSLRQHAEHHRPDYWCGLRPMTMDGPPILGPTAVENLYLNCGAGHLGWTFACGAARLVADAVSGREPELDIAGYALDRY